MACGKGQLRLRPRAARTAGVAQSYDYPVNTVGSTAHVTVLVATALGAAGMSLATKVLAAIEGAYLSTAAFFGTGVQLGKATCIIAPLSGSADGTGGAYHYTCADAVLYCDADIQRPQRTLALFVAELSEVGQAIQGKGWDCGASPGEGLSRFHAEVLFPATLDDYETASAWLDSTRQDYVTDAENTDQDEVSTGCSVLFLFWLVSLGYTMQRITQAGGRTLAATYSALTGRSSAWSDFAGTCEGRWPQGRPSKVTTDNPWPKPPSPPPPSPPSPPSPPPPSPPATWTIIISGTGPQPTVVTAIPTAPKKAEGT